MIQMNIAGYRRISKRTAEKLYYMGERIFLTASNMRPGGPWFPEVEIGFDGGNLMLETLNAFTYYNCDPARGKRINFWVLESIPF